MGSMGEAGHIWPKFRRALDAGNYGIASTLAWEVPRMDLADALMLTLLAAEHEPNRARFEAMARAWMRKLLEEVRVPPSDFAVVAQLFADVTEKRLPPSKALAPMQRAIEGKPLG